MFQLLLLWTNAHGRILRRGDKTTFVFAFNWPAKISKPIHRLFVFAILPCLMLQLHTWNIDSHKTCAGETKAHEHKTMVIVGDHFCHCKKCTEHWKGIDLSHILGSPHYETLQPRKFQVLRASREYYVPACEHAPIACTEERQNNKCVRNFELCSGSKSAPIYFSLSNARKNQQLKHRLLLLHPAYVWQYTRYWKVWQGDLQARIK